MYVFITSTLEDVREIVQYKTNTNMFFKVLDIYLVIYLFKRLDKISLVKKD